MDLYDFQLPLQGEDPCVDREGGASTATTRSAPDLRRTWHRRCTVPVLLA